MAEDDDWVESALMDNMMVAELLSRMKYSYSDFSSHTRVSPNPFPPPRWGRRRPRSKPPAMQERDSTRSPTTPLSWSSASQSGYNDKSTVGRSKGTFANGRIASANKKSRKRKTFAELKEEESLFLMERIHLNRELESMHVSLNEQRSRTDNCKRIKLDLNVQSPNKIGEKSNEPVEAAAAAATATCYHTEASTTVNKTRVKQFKNNDVCSRVEKNFESQKSCFILPDLNMLPSPSDEVEESGWL